MKTSITVKDIFNCTLERAFKAPILGDATQFLNGYQFQPGVTSFEEDETWGVVGGIRYPITNGNFMVTKGRIGRDEVLERIENKYWKWTLYDFETSALFFTTKAVGEWHVSQNEDESIAVTYIYTYTSKNNILHPITWLYMKFQNKGMMKKAMMGIKAQAESNCKFVYDR